MWQGALSQWRRRRPADESEQDGSELAEQEEPEPAAPTPSQPAGLREHEGPGAEVGRRVRFLPSPLDRSLAEAPAGPLMGALVPMPGREVPEEPEEAEIPARSAWALGAAEAFAAFGRGDTQPPPGMAMSSTGMRMGLGGPTWVAFPHVYMSFRWFC